MPGHVPKIGLPDFDHFPIQKTKQFRLADSEVVQSICERPFVIFTTKEDWNPICCTIGGSAGLPSTKCDWLTAKGQVIFLQTLPWILMDEGSTEQLGRTLPGEAWPQRKALNML